MWYRFLWMKIINQHRWEQMGMADFFLIYLVEDGSKLERIFPSASVCACTNAPLQAHF